MTSGSGSIMCAWLCVCVGVFEIPTSNISHLHVPQDIQYFLVDVHLFRFNLVAGFDWLPPWEYYMGSQYSEMSEKGCCKWYVWQEAGCITWTILNLYVFGDWCLADVQ